MNWIKEVKNDNVIKDLLGHSSFCTTHHYLSSRHPLRSCEEELREMYWRMRNKQSEKWVINDELVKE